MCEKVPDEDGLTGTNERALVRCKVQSIDSFSVSDKHLNTGTYLNSSIKLLVLDLLQYLFKQ